MISEFYLSEERWVRVKSAVILILSLGIDQCLARNLKIINHWGTKVLFDHSSIPKISILNDSLLDRKFHFVFFKSMTFITLSSHWEALGISAAFMSVQTKQEMILEVTMNKQIWIHWSLLSQLKRKHTHTHNKIPSTEIICYYPHREIFYDHVKE